MASSSSSEEYGARRPNRLVRHDSSFLGTIKHIVTAPLTWFANQDDDDTPGGWGKRRRVPPSAGLPAEQEDLAHRSKRMRIHSPHQVPPPPRRSSVVPRASSAVLPSSRATLSPRRMVPIARTMSIDPPRRDASFNFAYEPHDAMDMIVDRNSRPPSPRPSFRMRASLTPQPQQPPTRYISEPPPLNNLVSNPTFLRSPPSTSHEPSPAPTLGSIAESARATKSPTRHQHSSLHLSSTAPEDSNENKDAPAERALHLLDVYKTPLLPTRMRSSNLPASITATKTPDMFKSRRSAHLVLMQDDRDRNGRRVSGSGKSPLANETKPYAGEGGMKKLLARRKQEEEEENDQKEKDDEESTPRGRQPSPSPADPIPVPPVPTGSDWFSTAATDSGTASGSSLRVGRAKTSRNHIQRPAKTRYTAKYDEEADDGMDDDESQKERQMLEEAAKKVPVFQIPAGFSFAKDAPPIQPADLDKAKEPPITSLPFSFSKPAPTPAPAQAPSTSTTSLEVPAVPAPARAPSPEPIRDHESASARNINIPNFFATSSVLAKAKETPPAPIPTLNFTSSTPSNPFSFGSAPSANKSEPVKDTENPFWDGEKKKSADEPKSSLFAGFRKTPDAEPVKATPTSLFGTAPSAFPSLPKSTAEEPTTLPFSFSKPTAAQESGPSSLFGSTIAPEPLKSAFAFGAPSEVKPQTETPAPKPLFGASSTPSSLFGEASKPAAPSLFGEQPKTANVAPPQPSSAPLSFSFGAAPSSTPTSTPAPATQPSFFGAVADTKSSVQAPKSLFGDSGSNGFSFGQPAAQDKDKDKDAKPAPFSFGAPAGTPPAVEPKPASTSMFSFGQPSAPALVALPAPMANPSQPIAFSFGGGGSASADVSSKSMFMFNQPSTTAPPDRPVTPPKNNDVEFRMEESPTRDLQQANGNKTAATLNGAFSFGTSGSSALGGPLFGGMQNTTSSAPAPSPFGGFASSSSNPFGAKDSSNPFSVKENKPEEPKGFGGFGQNNVAPPITTSFSFGQSKSVEDAQRPSSGGGFTFGATPTSATAPNPGFAFGAPANTNLFGQPNTASAPSSPSAFNQPSPFGFGAPAPAPTSNGPFGFGSQPASPAGGANLNLPQSSGGFGGGGFGQPQQPSSPFSPPIALAPSTSGGAPGGSLFTIGAAPAAPPGGGPRQIKKLPNRRTAAKR